jgi:hypothetical protein
MVMMQAAEVPEGKYRRNVAVVLVAMLYVSTRFLRPEKMQCWGHVVTAISFVIWGFLGGDIGKSRTLLLLLLLLRRHDEYPPGLDRLTKYSNLCSRTPARIAISI